MTTHTDALSQVYARSLFELAENAGGLEKIVEIAGELEQICELARGDRAFREFLASPIIDRQKRADALGRCFRDQITDLTLRFLLVLNQKGRLAHLERINTSFDQMVQTAHDRVEVDIYTPAKLEPQQLEIILGRVRAALGKEPVLHQYTDPSMIGGLKLRIGDQLIDGSVSTRLRRLRHQIMTTGASQLQERIETIIDGDVEGEAGP